MFLPRLIISFLFLGIFSFPAGAETPEALEFFEKNIRPVLVDKCYKCHSAKSEKLKGELLLDSSKGILKGGSTGPAIVPSQPEKSLLIKAIHWSDPDLQMPPKEKLSAEQIKHFETWIKMGAPDPRKDETTAAVVPAYNFNEARKFWSFQPVRNPPLPSVKNKKWPQSPIDNFILAKLEQKGLQPATPATKRTLIRRATFDLTGLPPSPEEIKAFLDDKSPGAFEKVTDRLLASPAYGEQWGRHWLDVVRYADTSGCNSDYPIPAAHKYRNYVINAFNKDKPYDEFIREQLAGDLLPSDSEEEKFEQIIATGYLAISRRFGSRNNEFHLTIEDTIDNVGKGILGLSVSCARCHDHKFDPIPAKDYYALYGIFESTKYAFPGTEVYKHPKDFVPLAAGTNIAAVFKYQADLAALDDEMDKLSDQKREISAKLSKDDDDEKNHGPPDESKLNDEEKELLQKLKGIKADLEDARSKQKKLEANPPAIEKAYAVSEGKPADAKLQKKGSPLQLGEVVPRGFLQVLGGQSLPKEEKSSGRLQLAQWLTENPLTARVMVNRVWQHHFGKGIVATPNDFGVRGELPTHPELLDYLATQFVKNGWSIKKMHKLMMLSRTYQLSSAANEKNELADFDNTLLWRFNRKRLSAEEIRDAMLAVSGTLDSSMAEAHPFPPENEWRYTQHKPFVAVYETSHRSIYLMQQRIKKQPFLEIFDGADPNVTTADRPLSTTPLQSLLMMNNAFVHEQADRFGVRVGLANPDESKRISYAYELAFGRPATKEEISIGISYLRECREALKKTKVSADRQPRAALASYARVLFSSNEFLFVD